MEAPLREGIASRSARAGQAGVFVVGSINEDLAISTPHYPSLGETVIGTAIEHTPGGKGANQAVAAAAMGAPTTMVARVGDDPAGAAMLANLEHRGVGTGGVGIVEGTPSGQAIVLRTAEGENAIVVIPGTNATVDEAFVAEALGDLAADDVLVAQLEIPLPAVARALRLGRERGALTILNAAPAQRVDALLPLTDVLVVNEFELGVIAGSDRDVDAAVLALRTAERYGGSVIVTLGAAGALLASAGELHRIASFPVDAVDSTGAGDAFVGALASFLGAGHPLREAARWACAAGAIACLRPGAQGSSPTPKDLAAAFGVGPAREDAA